MSAKESFSAGQTREFFGGGDFFRLLETVAEITVEFFWQGREVAEAIGVQAGYAEYFRDRRFDRIRIYSATAQDVKWVTREGSDVRYDRGAASITGSVDLNAATIQQIRYRPEQQTGFWSDQSALVANTPITIIAPGTNTAGVVILGAQLVEALGANMTMCLVAKASPPANVLDGTNVLTAGAVGGVGTNVIYNGQLSQPVYLGAGQGLYLIANGAIPATALTMHSARWKNLP